MKCEFRVTRASTIGHNWENAGLIHITVGFTVLIILLIRKEQLDTIIVKNVVSLGKEVCPSQPPKTYVVGQVTDYIWSSIRHKC